MSEKKKKSEKKQENKRKKNMYNKVLSCTMISIVVVVILTIGIMGYLCVVSPKNFDKRAEAQLLASGLSIIGIAISV